MNNVQELKTKSPQTTVPPILEIFGLSLGLNSGQALVHDVSIAIGQGEIVGVVGESGSGKTLTGRSVIGLAPPGIHQTGGSIRFCGQTLAEMQPKQLLKLRGAEIGFVFQDPMTSLNPSMTIGDQLNEVLFLHGRGTRSERRQAVLEILAQVGIPDPESALDAWPHQFSGGMRQRIMIAAAMLLRPKLIVADEPTTALDAIVQRDVMELLVGLAQDRGTAVMLISHDLPMVGHYCGRIYVMKDGRVVEEGATETLLDAPRQDYTRALLSALPKRGDRPAPPKGPPVVQVKELKVSYSAGPRLFSRRKDKIALKAVDLVIGRGEVVAIVGQSGSGKTTLGKAIAGLIPASAGRIEFAGNPLERGRKMTREQRRNCQFVFQDPHSSLDPRMTVRQILAEPLRHDRLRSSERETRIIEVLDEVGLDADYLSRLPHQLSGGQKQRVAIARAIIRQPAFIVADEAVSALDVTVRAQVLDLFSKLQQRYGFSCLFVSHDLGAVEQVADRVVVMRDGAIVEEGSVQQIFDKPNSSYTRQLLSALPVLQHTERGVRLGWRTVSNSDICNRVEKVGAPL